MSSFICSSKTFNSIERAVIYLTQDRNFYFPYEFKEVFPEMYNNLRYSQYKVDQAVRQVVDTIRDLNVLCVSLQYKHHYEGVLDAEISQQREVVFDRSESTILTKVGLFKQLRCVSYQIEEEHLQELRELTTDEKNALFFIKEMSNCLACQIVSDLPEYEKIKWDL